MAGTLSNRELDVMQALWDLGSGTVAEVQQLLQDREVPLARTTVATLLDRLEDKGAIRRARKAAPGTRRYESAIAREATGRRALARLVDTVFGGRPGLAMTHLASDDRLTHDDLRKLQQLLNTRLAPRRPAPPHVRALRGTGVIVLSLAAAAAASHGHHTSAGVPKSVPVAVTPADERVFSVDAIGVVTHVSGSAPRAADAAMLRRVHGPALVHFIADPDRPTQTVALVQYRHE